MLSVKKQTTPPPTEEEERERDTVHTHTHARCSVHLVATGGIGKTDQNKISSTKEFEACEDIFLIIINNLQETAAK